MTAVTVATQVFVSSNLAIKVTFSLKLEVFWDITVCYLVNSYLHFGGACWQKTCILISTTMRIESVTFNMYGNLDR
jgi:hypothetical protein